MGIYDQLGSAGQTYQLGQLKKITDVESGITKPWETPEYKTMFDAFSKGFLSNKSEIERVMPAKGITGGAAAQLFADLYSDDTQKKLGAINQIMQQYSGAGADIARGGMEGALKEYQAMLQYILGKKQIKSQEKIARAGQMTSGFTSGASSGCCFIFIQGEGTLTDYVRKYRDSNYRDTGNVARGYKWMASWLVPLMTKSKFVKWIVRKLMTQPLTQYAIWDCGDNKYGWIFKPFKFWVFIWNVIGKIRKL